jgi:hypothetical protein
MASTQKSGLQFSINNIQDYIMNKGLLGAIRTRVAMRKHRKEAEEISFQICRVN